MPAPRNPVSRRRSVVYLETAPRGAFEGREERRAVMDQRNQTFVPHVLAITTGTTVDFPNSDPTYHNVFSLSKTRPFDLGRYAAGRSKAVRFDRPGIVREITDVLAAHAVNIDTLRTETRDAPMSGGRLFEAVATLEVPADADVGALRVALEKLANELMVDITLDTGA